MRIGEGIRFKAWGEVRYTWKDPTLDTTPTYKLLDYTFTGQFSYMDDPSTGEVTEGFGLMYYNARWYDPYLNRFAQADSIIPGAGNPQAWDRYAYTQNNPVRYTDPTGHDLVDKIKEHKRAYGKFWHQYSKQWNRTGNYNDLPDLRPKDPPSTPVAPAFDYHSITNMPGSIFFGTASAHDNYGG